MPRNVRGSSQPVTKMEPRGADCVMRWRSRLIHLGASLARSGGNGVRVLSVFCPRSTANQRQSGVRVCSGVRVFGSAEWR
jgi:hypothetical protein